MNWSEVPSLSALRALEAAVRHQSLSKAARELNVTHAAIAQHVRALESEFSQSLLVRQGRGVVGTEAGQKLASGLNEGFARVAEAVDELRDSNANRPLNVTLTPTFATSWLMPRIGEFWSKYPEISVNLNPTNVVVDLKRDGFDLAIRHGRGDWPGFKAELLGGSEFWAVGSPSMLGDGVYNCVGDLADLPWLVEEHVRELKGVMKAEGLDLDAVDVKTLGTNGLVLSAVKAGLGVSIQAKPLVEQDVARGELIKVCHLNQDGYGYHTVTIPGRSPNGLREFVRWLHRAA